MAVFPAIPSPECRDVMLRWARQERVTSIWSLQVQNHEGSQLHYPSTTFRRSSIAFLIACLRSFSAEASISPFSCMNEQNFFRLAAFSLIEAGLAHAALRMNQ